MEGSGFSPAKATSSWFSLASAEFSVLVVARRDSIGTSTHSPIAVVKTLNLAQLEHGDNTRVKNDRQKPNGVL